MVSIVVPVYNVEKYLRCCLDSIKQQTYTDFEVIMVDDGSTDGSGIICEQYEKADDRFHLIRQENKGLASARNTGIRAAKGDFLYFVDSDDCIHISLLEIVVKVAEREHANIVQIGFADVPSDFTDFHREVEGLEKLADDDAKTDTCKDSSKKGELQDGSPKDSLIIKYSWEECIYLLEKCKPGIEYQRNLQTVVVWTKLYRVSAFKTLLFPEGMRLHEDQMVAHRNFIQAGGMVYVDLPLHFYRKAQASLIRVGWTPKRLAIFDCYEDRINCLLQQKKEKNQYVDLINFVYLRYLVCIFRNYQMAEKTLTGQEKSNCCKEIKQKMKLALKAKTGKIAIQYRCFFRLFLCMPNLICQIVKKR